MADEPTRLNSWKEIAAYLDRDVRTVMRWEKRHALPVHRVPPGGKGRSVFAYPHELNAWLEGGAADPAGAEAPDRKEAAPRRTSVLLWVGLAALAVAAAVTIFLAALSEEPTGEVVQLAYRGNRLVAMDGAGEILWSHQLNRRLHRMSGRKAPESHVEYDLDGDGVKEILVNENFYAESSSVEEGRLFCFSSRGELRWKYLFEDTLNFGEDQFQPPWRGGPLVVYAGSEGPRIAWSLRHLWWPSVVVVLDQSGTPLERFVHPGWILNLSVVDAASGPLLLAGGISNEHSSAMLTILDGNNVSGSPPGSGDARFACKNCSPGRPLRYLLFPRSELNVAAGLPHNRLNGVDITDHGFNLRCLEAEAPLPTSAERIFEMGLDFTIARVKYSDGYWSYHRLQELEKRLDHSAEECPQRSGPVLIRCWSPDAGWTRIEVPQ